MALSEIEKLERRYAENPQGLTFAPLAEVHRKNGEVQRALDLLGPGLAIHPDYIPASIVRGRCHMDLGDVHAAETAFLHVLALDGENVIALKALADISERLLKFDDAERWLNTLLSVDRSNDEAREQLQRVEISQRQAGVASSAQPSSVLESPSGVEAESAAGAPPPGFEPPVAEPAVGWVSQSVQQADPAPLEIEMEVLEPSALREPLEEPARPSFLAQTDLEPEEPFGIELAKPPHGEEPYPADAVEPLDGLVGREVDLPDDGSGDNFTVETSEDIRLESGGGSEFQMPDASQELFGSRAQGERAPFEEDVPLAPSAAWDAPLEEPRHDDGPGSYPPDSYEPEPFVHEPPGEEPVAAEPPAAQPVRSYGAGATGGRSVAQLFKAILSSRPPVQAAAAPIRHAPAPGAGAPTRPAADALSLSSVFGEEGTEAPPAVPSPGQGAGSVSFDDFFSSSSTSPASRPPRAPDPKKDDLDQFHAWLQNLKR